MRYISLVLILIATLCQARASAVPSPSPAQASPTASAASNSEAASSTPTGETGLQGTVTDTSGAIVVGAAVTLKSAAGESKSTQTDGEGKFSITGLPPGNYDISVTAQGFAEFHTAGFSVPAGKVSSLDVRLQLAATATQVNVQGIRPEQVETENATVSGTITRQEVVSLGLNGRNFTQLIALAPGVSNQTSQDEAKVGVAGSAKYSVNGGRVEYNTFEVNGSDVLNTDIAASHGHTTLLVYPSLDAIQELKVLTSNYGAQFGRTASGTVQVVTKSGGAQYHGVGYEFLRNEVFNARNFFDPPGKAPLYRRNDFGGTIGGPLYIPGFYNEKKDQTFFFFSEEFRRERSPYGFNQGVPSDAERGYDPTTQTYGSVANFSDVCPFDPDTQFSLVQYPDCASFGSTVSPRQSFLNFQFTIDPTAQAILQSGIIPRANATAGCNSSVNSCYVGTVSPSESWREELIGIDHNFSSSTKGAFHAIHDHWDTTTGVPQWANVINSFPSVLNSFDGPGMTVNSNVTSVVSPTTVNNFSVGYTWQHIVLSDLPGPGVSLSRSGLDSLQYPLGYLFNNGQGGKLPGIVIGGNNAAYGGSGFAVDTSYMPWSHQLLRSFLRDDVSKVFGKHTLQMGIQVVRAVRHESSAVNGANTGNVQGLLRFSNTSNLTTTGNAFADFLLNTTLEQYNPNASENIQYYQQDSVQAPYNVTYWDAEPYLQDDWRVMPRLTINLGLRLSLFGNWQPAGQNLYNWVPSEYDSVVWTNSGLSVNSQHGYLQSGNGYYGSPVPLDVNNLNSVVTNGLVQCGTNSMPASCQSSHVFNPAPRVGFAWDPWGGGKTSIRGGYGMFYEHGTGSEANAGSLMGNPPQVLSMTQDYPQNYNQIGNTSGTHALYPFSMISIPAKNTWPYVQQWSLGIQRELAPDTILTAAYVGSKGTHLAMAMQINQLPPVSNANNPFHEGQPVTANLCHANGIDPQNPYSPTGFFYFDTSDSYLYYSDNPAAVTGLIAACNGTQATTGHQAISFDLNVLRPYQGIGPIASIQNVGSSTYNSLQVTLRRHHGPLDLAASYTYGHSVDTASDRYESTFVDSFNLRANRASSDFDQRHLLNLSYLYKLPLLDTGRRINTFFGGEDDAGKNSQSGSFSIARAILGNWALSGITVFQSGTPFSIVNGASASGISVLDNAGLALGLGADSYPDLAPAGASCSPSTMANDRGTVGPVLGNRCKYVAPRGLTQGNAGRNSERNPNRLNFDWALLRDFKVRDRLNLQFRMEAFNLFNTTQFRIYDPIKGNTASNTISCYGEWDSLYTVGVSFSAGAPSCKVGNGFLRPVDAHRPRTLQFGLKFDF